MPSKRKVRKLCASEIAWLEREIANCEQWLDTHPNTPFLEGMRWAFLLVLIRLTERVAFSKLEQRAHTFESGYKEQGHG